MAGISKRMLDEAEVLLGSTPSAKTGMFSVEEAIKAMVGTKPVFVRKMTREMASKIKTSVELICPLKAAKIMKTTPFNRQTYRGSVKRYAADMSSDRWTVSPDAIAFDERGHCFNAIHRLSAVIESGKPQWFVVVRGLPVESRSVTDTGKSRSLDDMLQSMGLKAERSSKIGPLVRGMMRSPGSRESLSPPMLLECAMRLKKGIEFVCRNLPSGTSLKRVAVNPVRCAIGKAFYSVDEKRLEKFCEILRHGQVGSDKDKASYELREFLLTDDGRFRCKEDANALYGRTCTAIESFLEGEETPKRQGKIRRCEIDPFRLPVKLFAGMPEVSKLKNIQR